MAEVSAAMARQYEAGDRDACLAVFDSNVPRYFRTAERADFGAFVEALPGPYLVLEDERRIVACGGYALREGAGIADLCWGMVARDRHRSGLGRELTRARMDAARRHPGVRELALETSQLTTAFYERLGFEIVDVTPDGYAEGLDRCTMRLRLGEP